MTEEMKNDYPGEWHLGPLTKPTVEPRGYVHLSPEATDQLNRIEEMLKRLIGEDESVKTEPRVYDWVTWPDAIVTITEDGRTMYEVDKP